MLPRVLEPELMDSPDEAQEYNSMDHGEVNRQCVADLLLAAGWEAQAAVDETGPIQSSVEPDCAAISPEVLDLGTGTALIPIELCRSHPLLRVLAVDGAASMLQVAGVNIALAGLESRIMLDRLDAKSLPFLDDRFAVVISNSIVHHLAEPLAALREAVRVAAPGGLLFFRDLLRPADEAELEGLVTQYAGEASEHQRQMFADSLRAALTLGEIRELVVTLGFPPETVAATSDRHWTWSASKTGSVS